MVEGGFLAAAERVNGAVPGERTEDHAVIEGKVAGNYVAGHKSNRERRVDPRHTRVLIHVLIVIFVLVLAWRRGGSRRRGRRRRSRRCSSWRRCRSCRRRARRR